MNSISLCCEKKINLLDFGMNNFMYIVIRIKVWINGYRISIRILENKVSLSIDSVNLDFFWTFIF